MAKKYAGGGFVGAAGTNRGAWSGDGELGVRTGTKTGTTASNRPASRDAAPSKPKAPKAPPKAMPKAAPPAAKAAAPKKPNYGDVVMFKKPGTGTNWPGQSARPPGAPGTANPEGKGDREMRKGGVVKNKKSFGKRMAMGGPADRDGTSRYGKNMSRPGMPGVRAGQQAEKPGMRMGQRPSAPPVSQPMPMPTPPPGMVGSAPRMQRPLPPIDMSKIKPMRGGGLAQKGVGQALAKGGLVKGAGCAQRGVKKPRMK